MKALPVEPSNVPVAIGSRIRAARQSQRLTIEQVADATGLTKGFLSRVERDLTSPSVASLVTLCQVLSISIGDLFAAPETHLTKQNEGPRISLGGEGIVERLVAEGDRSPADLVMTVDIANLRQIVEAGVIQPVQSDVLEAAIPAAMRDPGDQWFALTSRARVVYASRDRVADGDAGADTQGLLTGAQLRLWFQDVQAEAVRTWLSHPAAQAWIRYDGFADGGGHVYRPSVVRIGAPPARRVESAAAAGAGASTEAWSGW